MAPHVSSFEGSDDFDLDEYSRAGNGMVEYNVLKRAVKLLKRQERKYADLYSIYRNKEEEVKELSAKAAGYRNQVENQRFHLGRNQIRKKDMTAFERGNIDTIGTFLKELFRHHKILDPSWSLFLPKDPNSFYSKIRCQLDFPDDYSDEFYWTKTVVPMVNSKMCDIRSDATKGIRRGYMDGMVENSARMKQDMTFLTSGIFQKVINKEEISYEDLTRVYRFVTTIVSKLIGKRALKTKMKDDKGKSPFDIITLSDIAYSLTIIANNVDKWDQEHEILRMSSEEREKWNNPKKLPEDERKNYIKKQPKFTNKKGNKAAYKISGLNKAGTDYFREGLGVWRSLRKNQAVWDLLIVGWDTYNDDVGWSEQWTANDGRNALRERETMEELEDVAPGAFAMPGEDGFEYDGRPEENEEEDDENSRGQSEDEEGSGADSDVGNCSGGESDSDDSRKSMPSMPPLPPPRKVTERRKRKRACKNRVSTSPG